MVSALYDDHTARCVSLILTLPLYHRFPKYVPEKVPTFGSTPKVLEPQRLSAFFPKKSRFFPRHVIARRRGRRPLRPRAQASPQGETFPGGRLPPLRFATTRKIERRGKGPKWSSAPTVCNDTEDWKKGERAEVVFGPYGEVFGWECVADAGESCGNWKRMTKIFPVGYSFT